MDLWKRENFVFIDLEILLKTLYYCVVSARVFHYKQADKQLVV